MEVGSTETDTAHWQLEKAKDDSFVSGACSKIVLLFCFWFYFSLFTERERGKEEGREEEEGERGEEVEHGDGHPHWQPE